MEFDTPRRRLPRDSAVPMINIVFLLLIFFLLTATLSERAPFRVVLPESTAEIESDGSTALYVAADGTLSWRGAQGDAALEGLSAAVAAGQKRIELRADKALPGPELARILARLGALGIAEVGLVVGVR
ncbi:MAG: ExbD/TolR family protein [Pikeienuella sp.]